MRNISNNNNNNNINYNIYLFNVASLQIATTITFNNSTVLPNVDYRAAVKLEITSIGEVTWAYSMLTSTTAQSIEIVHKKL